MADFPLNLIVSLPAFLLAIVLHELAHGYTAYLCGDDTAKRAGRLTFSPLAHLDLVGTIFFVASSIFGIGFGWAKPVPISVARMRHPLRDEVLVTLAGPAANFAQAAAWALLLRLVVWQPVAHIASGSLLEALVRFCAFGVLINVVLMVFNLLPIPPLDGSHVAARLLGFRELGLVERMAPLGFIVLLLVLRSPIWNGVWSAVIRPIALWLMPGPAGL